MVPETLVPSPDVVVLPPCTGVSTQPFPIGERRQIHSVTKRSCERCQCGRVRLTFNTCVEGPTRQICNYSLTPHARSL